MSESAWAWMGFGAAVVLLVQAAWRALWLEYRKGRFAPAARARPMSARACLSSPAASVASTYLAQTKRWLSRSI